MVQKCMSQRKNKLKRASSPNFRKKNDFRLILHQPIPKSAAAAAHNFLPFRPNPDSVSLHGVNFEPKRKKRKHKTKAYHEKTFKTILKFVEKLGGYRTNTKNLPAPTTFHFLLMLLPTPRDVLPPIIRSNGR